MGIAAALQHGNLTLGPASLNDRLLRPDIKEGEVIAVRNVKSWRCSESGSACPVRPCSTADNLMPRLALLWKR